METLDSVTILVIDLLNLYPTNSTMTTKNYQNT